jgi:hypothetical protein
MTGRASVGNAGGRCFEPRTEHSLKKVPDFFAKDLLQLVILSDSFSIE